MIAEEAPLPCAPLVFGANAVTANPKGRFDVVLPAQEDTSIFSGLKALKILDYNGEEREEISGTSGDIEEFVAALGVELQINVLSRIQPEPMCQTFRVGRGEELLRFPYANRFG